MLFNMKVCCVIPFESPLEAILMSTHTYHYKYNYKYKKENTRNYPKYNNYSICSYWIFWLELKKNEFEIAVVNEPLVFEPLKFIVINYWGLHV